MSSMLEMLDNVINEIQKENMTLKVQVRDLQKKVDSLTAQLKEVRIRLRRYVIKND